MGMWEKYVMAEVEYVWNGSVNIKNINKNY